MSKEKQIEEMAKVMCGYYGTEKCYDCRYCCDCHIKQEANRLYDAGYHKQIEGEWVEKNIFFAIYKCSICGAENSYKDGFAFLSKFCPKCGARMKGGE